MHCPGDEPSVLNNQACYSLLLHKRPDATEPVGTGNAAFKNAGRGLWNMSMITQDRQVSFEGEGSPHELRPSANHR